MKNRNINDRLRTEELTPLYILFTVGIVYYVYWLAIQEFKIL